MGSSDLVVWIFIPVEYYFYKYLEEIVEIL